MPLLHLRNCFWPHTFHKLCMPHISHELFYVSYISWTVLCLILLMNCFMSHTSHELFYASYISWTVLCLIHLINCFMLHTSREFFYVSYISWTVSCLIHPMNCFMSHTSHELFYASYKTWEAIVTVMYETTFGSVLISVGNVFFLLLVIHVQYFLVSQFDRRCLFTYKQTKPLKYGQ